MMELHDAVSQIAAIRRQMARSATFGGYRPATTAFTGLVAIAAAVTQGLLISDPVRQSNHYLELWTAAAVVSLIVVGAELVLWARRSPSHMRSEMTLAAVHSFAPCLVAGGLVTFVVAMFQGQLAWTLAGIWPILFGIGMFASAPMAGRGLNLVGAFYLLAGLLIFSRPPAVAMQPWWMGATFGIGQFMAAIVVFLKRRREIEHEAD